MCGICGLADYKNGSISEARIRAMADKMVHRGPDDSGLYCELDSTPQVALGHRRLSIIDLSGRARQPMSNEDGRIRIIFNGEIYNYKELKAGLEARGHIFNSGSDTEVVVHLYEDRGADCVKYLRGMFAFAVWDSAKKELLIARDRVGKKPLLYCHEGDKFCFASEFSSLLESGMVDREINREAVDSYLTLGYIPSPLTIYKNVFKLPPAHLLILRDNKLTIKPYWRLDYDKKLSISESEASEETLRLLGEAVKIRLYSDVPLGAFLSGGIDSSAVVALMARAGGSKVKTFSIGFEEKAYNELGYARDIARRFDTEHHEFIVKPDALKVLPILVEKYGEPYADSSCIPTYYVANQTRQYVTVALNGDGGDESFAGYERYQAMVASEIYHKAPSVLRSAVKGLASMLPDSFDSKNRLRRLKRFFDGIDLPLSQRYLRWIGIFSNGMKGSLYSGEFKEGLGAKGPLELLKPYLDGHPDMSLLDRLLMADTNTYLPDDLLVKVDIASMANSLEARSPFLDHKLMEFAASLPSEYKMKHFVKKYILKTALKDLIQSKNLHRPKMGFGMPVGSWFRNELKDFLIENLLSEASLRRGYFAPRIIKGMVSEHISARRDHSLQLWTLLMFELWHQRFID